MRPKAIKTSTYDAKRERLDQLIDVVTLLIARRQMERYWARR